MKKMFLAGVVTVVLAGCEYIPNKVYEIKAVDGQTLKLLCPTVDQGRSTFTYLIDHGCRLVK